VKRCDWCVGDALYERYHDEEWGVPLTVEERMFEFLLLEGAQAGLSWLTILRKREGYRRAFMDFSPHAVARMSDKDLEERLTDPAIVRNRRKVYAARDNARATLDLYEAGSSLLEFFWGFMDMTPQQNHWRSMSEVPAQTPLSNTMSRELRKRGFRFVGPTIVYAHMQAAGMVNDHLVGCPRHAACTALGKAFSMDKQQKNT